MHLKKLYRETAQPSHEQMNQVVQAAFGHVLKISEVDRWFTHLCGLEFLKAEARLKRRCGHLTPGVLANVKRLLRQLCASFGFNGQCTVSNLKRALMDQELCSSGPKVDFLQRVYHYIQII